MLAASTLKIDRNKFNTILRSGLNPNVKTRKQLAAQLSLDPTTLTRWFATRDRLGNPRYPVIPDRHVTNILQIFNLDPQSLSLDEEAFRQYCFEHSLSQTQQASELAQKDKLRLDNVSQRKMNIDDYSVGRKKNLIKTILPTAIVILVLGLLINNFYFNDSTPITPQISMASQDIQCWTGYSPSMGVFDEPDDADPCHYGKLFHRALMQLKAENNNPNLPSSSAESSGPLNYIEFLYTQLEHRRISDNISLNFELGKSEMRRLNFQAARLYFAKANTMLATLPNSNPQMSAEISAYMEKLPAKKIN